MASEVKKLYDESDGLKKRVDHTAERLNDVEIRFADDQDSINDVNNTLVYNSVCIKFMSYYYYYYW